MASFTIPYMLPLFLGMTFDARLSSPGVDIYDSKYVNDPVITNYKQTKSSYKITESNKDVNDELNLSGDLSLKIKTGMIKVEGTGSCIKNSIDFQRSIQILVSLQYTSHVKSFKADAKPRDKWVELYSPDVLGTHYVSSITYGASIMASLQFEVYNVSDFKEVKGAVKTTFEPSGSALNLTVGGKLEALKKKLQDKCNITISYYGTVPLKSIPNTMEGFVKLITTFKEQIEEAKLTGGIPLQMQLTSLEDIADAVHRGKFKFNKNKNNEQDLVEIENELDELFQARLVLTAWAKALPYHLEEKYEKEVGQLIKNITLVIEVFYEVIWKLDMTKGPEQFQRAKDAYDYDGKRVYNRYNKLVTRITERLNPLIKRYELTSDTYTQWGNNRCTAAKTQVLYEGFAISSTEEGIGGTGQYECVPKSPQKGYDLDDGSVKSHLAGIRYTKLDKDVNPFQGEHAKKISEKGVTCAKCYSPDSASVVMFSATEKCPLTWEKMYTGYLMSSREGGHTTQYVCVDDTPAEGYQMDSEEHSKDTMALTVVHSPGSLPKEGYVKKALIRCVVCAMKSNQISF